ncbi:hypothetical protein EZV62_006332 [Acer yangbiense]|uniref:Uncharacterized protein n=1 Tax=Acer yangbiense TaxID=1000413 RepID=A0A5C7IPS8_9ROSI|nr:hypothetical protein EZV62_006332 [Acer yangbiense]
MNLNLLDLIWVFEFHEAMANLLRRGERGCEGVVGLDDNGGCIMERNSIGVDEQELCFLGACAEYCLPLVRVDGLFVAAKGHDPQFPKWHVELTSVFDMYWQEKVRNAERAVQLMGASLLQLCSVVACIVYKYKTAVRAVRHFAHYARATSAAATAARENGLVEIVANWFQRITAEQKFVIANFILEIPSAVFDELSSVHKPQYALYFSDKLTQLKKEMQVAVHASTCAQ